jgi:hypothetical protein
MPSFSQSVPDLESAIGDGAEDRPPLLSTVAAGPREGSLVFALVLVSAGVFLACTWRRTGPV